MPAAKLTGSDAHWPGTAALGAGTGLGGFGGAGLGGVGLMVRVKVAVSVATSGAPGVWSTLRNQE